jgi:hypothetical protein
MFGEIIRASIHDRDIELEWTRGFPLTCGWAGGVDLGGGRALQAGRLDRWRIGATL